MPKLKKYTQIYEQESSFMAGHNESENNGNLDSQHDQQSESKYSIDVRNQHKQSHQSQEKEIQSTKKKRTTKSKKAKQQRIMKADQILQKIMQQCNHEQASDSEQTNIDIPDFNVKPKKKKNPNTAKIKNKFFDIEVEPTDSLACSNLQDQELNLVAKRHNQEELNRLTDLWEHKIQVKANQIKERQQLKNTQTPQNYKKDLHKKLEGIEDSEEIDVIVNVPKLFRGKSGRVADGALYLKNSQKVDQVLDVEQQNKSRNSQNNQKQKKIQRSDYFMQVDRQIRDERAINFFNKENFKKSSFDEIEADIEKHNYLFEENNNESSLNNSKSFSRRLVSRNTSSKSRGSESLGKNQHSIQSIKDKDSKIQIVKQQLKQTSNSEPIQPKNQSILAPQLLNNQSKKNQIELKTNQNNGDPSNRKNKNNDIINNKKSKDQINKKIKEAKNNKSKGKKTSRKNQLEKKRKQIESYFQNEAEDSQNGYGDDGYSTGSDIDYDQGQFQDLIDKKDVKYIKKNEAAARRKFIEEQHRQQDEIINRIKDRILKPQKIKCEENSESRRRRRQRIEANKKRFEEEDGKDNGLIQFNENGQQQQKDRENCYQVNDFDIRLKQLEAEIGSKQEKETQKPKILQKPKRIPKNIWKNVKSSKRQKNNEKRGGFIKKQGAYTGHRVSGEKKKRKSIVKQINFDN